MFTRCISMLVLGAALGFLPAPGWAVDIPEGGDAAHYQIDASSAAVIATFVRREDHSYSFNVTDVLRGNPPKTLVLEDDGYLTEYAWKVGESYLLYLRTEDNAMVLATSIYSIQPVAKAEVPAYKEAMASYLANLASGTALKSALRKHVESPVGYLQYSAVADLTRLQLLDKGDIADLGKLLAAKKIVDPRAKSLVIEGISTTGLRDFVPLLESVATDKSEAIMARGAAISALQRLGAADSLKKIAPSILGEQSPALLRKLMPDAVGKVRQ